MADETKVRIKDERTELSGLDAGTLRTRLNDERKRLWNYRFAQGKRQLESTAVLSSTRKRIARIHTYLRALELGETK